VKLHLRRQLVCVRETLKKRDAEIQDVQPWWKPVDHLSTLLTTLTINATYCSDKIRPPDGAFISANDSF
jgi:hypothetical protein